MRLRLPSSFRRPPKHLARGLGVAFFAWNVCASHAIASEGEHTIRGPAMLAELGLEVSPEELSDQVGTGILLDMSSGRDVLDMLVSLIDRAQGETRPDAHLAMAETTIIDTAPRSLIPVPLQQAQLFLAQSSPVLDDKLLQLQISAPIDSTLRYLCPDKLYADLYPKGAGWNNHTYADCGARGQLEPEHLERRLVSVAVPSEPPPVGSGGTSPIIPCGDTLANISIVVVGSQAMRPAPSDFRPIATLVSATSHIGAGHGW